MRLRETETERERDRQKGIRDRQKASQPDRQTETDREEKDRASKTERPVMAFPPTSSHLVLLGFAWTPQGGAVCSCVCTGDVFVALVKACDCVKHRQTDRQTACTKERERGCK